MDRIPCKIDFNIIEKPNKPYTASMLAEVDGHLSIIVDGKLVFSEDYICLAEFAVKLERWLEADYPNASFNYESMDYEDSTIIKLDIIDDNIAFSSPWSVKNISSPIMISRVDFINSVKAFLEQFEAELPGIYDLFY